MNLNTVNVGFIGAGNMAKAIGGGFIKAGVLKNTQITVSAPSTRNLKEWIDLGVSTTTENGKVVADCNIIFLAMKPFQLDAALKNLKDTLPKKTVSNKLFVSILAGIESDDIVNKIKAVGLADVRLIRVMPNTPMMVMAGCSVYSPHVTATENDIAMVTSLISSLGLCTMVPEHLIVAAGALAGCGPAYVYVMIEALSDGGVMQGLPRDMATTFAAQTLLGAAKMVLETGKHPEQLKDEVCSPGGNTIRGVHAMERGGVRAALIDAIQAAVQRTQEMTQLYKSK